MLLTFLLPFYFVGFFVYNVEFLFVIHILVFFIAFYVFSSNFVSDFFENRILFIKAHISEFFSNYYFSLLYIRVFVSYFRVFLFITLIYFFSYFFSIFSLYSNSFDFHKISTSTNFLSSTDLDFVFGSSSTPELIQFYVFLS